MIYESMIKMNYIDRKDEWAHFRYVNLLEEFLLSVYRYAIYHRNMSQLCFTDMLNIMNFHYLQCAIILSC